MGDLSTTTDLFFTRTGMNKSKVEKTLQDTLNGCDDGELFLEYSQSESLSFDDGRIRSASFDTNQGFGLRALADETTGFAHSSSLTDEAIKRACDTVKFVKNGYSGTFSDQPQETNLQLYSDQNPLPLIPYQVKVKTLEAIDNYARGKDKRIKQVSASLVASWQAIQIIKQNGFCAQDIRPLIRLNVSIVASNGQRMEMGSYGTGGRTNYDDFINEDIWKKSVDESVRQALINLESVDTPGGEMPVVLGPGWPGVLLHEAVGHGLEGDFNRKKTSAFSELLGTQVAAKGVNVIDDGTIRDRRGSLSIDDEGTPTAQNILIEDGILVGFLQDRLNARLMGVKPTGNGRRQSHAHSPMPRMTNTYMDNGSCNPEEIIGSVKKGLYAVNFGGGQVDITSGKFVFSATEAYLIENGRIGAPVKGATLIGNGPDCLTKVSMIGNNMELDAGIGSCGKDGQSVPVGVGQPTLKLDSLTVGGTAV
jgi:TldD protein